MTRSVIHSTRKVLAALCATLLCVLALAVHPAAAEPRVALVIGNSAYKGDLPALPNPANDAKLMAQSLKNVGFDVVEAENASQADMKRAIAEFSDKLSAAGAQGTGLFFYAGHGVQVAGENYLIPVDAVINKEADVDLAAVSATTVMKQMDFAGSAVNIIILDACRNNPLSSGTRGMSRGLAEITSTPRGSFIAYSTAPGSTAADGDGVNSPYTKALSETIQEPGLSISDVFQEVRTKVLAATGNQQTPWDSSSLTGRFYFKPGEAQVASLTPPSQPQVTQPTTPSTGSVVGDEKLAYEKEFWDSVKDSGDPDAIQLYLNKYPEGYFVDAANAKLADLKSTKTASVTPAQQPTSPSTNGQIDHSDTQQPQEAAAPVVAMIALNQTVYAKRDGRMRASPDGKAALVTSFPPNTELTATGRTSDGKWWRIALGDGQVGYMHQSVIAEQPFQTASAPQAQPAAVAPQQPAAAADSSSIVLMDGGQPTQSNNPNVGVSPAQAQQLVSAAQNPQGVGAQVLNGLFGAAGQMFSGNGQQIPTPSNNDNRIAFAAYNHAIMVRGGAIILDSAGNGTPIAQVLEPRQMQASARTSNGSWYQVVLPNGNLGYLAGNWVQR